LKAMCRESGALRDRQISHLRSGARASRQRRFSRIFTGYPRFKLRHESLPQELIHTFRSCMRYMAFPWSHRVGRYWMQQWNISTRVVSELTWPEISRFRRLCRAVGLLLAGGREGASRGARYICDRGSSHIRTQDQLLREEHERWACPMTASTRES